MSTTQYFPFDEINELQTTIMKFIDAWVREKKTPVPHQEILKAMTEKGTHAFTTANALNSLLDKGYVRRAYTRSNRTFYVQQRTI